MPVSAKEKKGTSSEDSYALLENVASSFLGREPEDAVRFSDLSKEVKSFLEECDIDSDRIGKLYPPEDEDGTVLTAIYLLEDNRLVVTAMTGFSQNENGEYSKKSPLTPMNRSWTAT